MGGPTFFVTSAGSRVLEHSLSHGAEGDEIVSNTTDSHDFCLDLVEFLKQMLPHFLYGLMTMCKDCVYTYNCHE